MDSQRKRSNDDQSDKNNAKVHKRLKTLKRRHVSSEHFDDKQSNEEVQQSSDRATKEKHRPCRKPRKRGRTQMKKVVKNKIDGVKETIKYNARDQGIGEEAARFQNYLGVLARQLVPIHYEDWLQVPDHIVQNILDEALRVFVVKESSEEILSSVGKKWRDFKVRLNKKYIAKYVENPDMLKTNPKILEKPPEEYPEITEGDWKKFVASRTSKEFLVLRKKQQRSRARIKYPYRGSRFGYANLEAKFQQQHGTKNEFDRADLWILAREDRNGVIKDDETEKKANLIIELRKQRDRGEVVEIGSNDILGQALGTAEPSGRVRARGHGVTPKIFFKKPAGGMRQLQEEQIKFQNLVVSRFATKFDEQEKRRQEQDLRFQEQEKRIRELETKFSGNTKKPAENVSLEEGTAETPDISKTMQSGTTCKLAVDNLSNIVAIGKLAGTEGIVHCRKLGDSDYRVSVLKAIIGNALLPVPVGDELVLVSEAVGSFVSWPKHLVIFSDFQPKTKLQKEKKSLPKNDEVVQQTHSSTKPSFKAAIPSLDVPEYVPRGLRILMKSVKEKSTSFTITIPVPHDNFGNKIPFIYISKEDIIHIATMDQIGAPCISVYMWWLYTKLQNQKRTTLFGFIDPSWMSTFNSNDEQIRARRLVAEIESKKKHYWLIPYNSGRHWTLIVINTQNKIIYFLDPIHGLPTNDIKKVMRLATAMLSFNLVLRSLNCPKQPNDVECGFYVMRYMRDIVLNPKPSEYFKAECSKKTDFTIEEINEVREEWTDGIIEYANFTLE